MLLFVGFACSKDNDDLPDNGGDDNNGGTTEPAPAKIYPLGITRISADSLAFVLYAPGKTTVHLIGDFNNWEAADSYKMTKDGNNFRISIGGLDSSKEYVCQYLIDNSIRIADPYCNKISDPAYDAQIPADIYPNLIQYPAGKTSAIAMVVGTKEDKYSWKVSDYQVGDVDQLVIYEILIRDFTEKRSIKGVQEKLPYLKSLGVNAIELMPFNEFEGNDSWGYNPSFYFATDKAYGTSNDYKDFIDACHQQGMAVIMDMVLNHSYGESPLLRMYQNSSGAPTSSNPWYNTTSPNQTYSWGYDFNHESPFTQQFVDSVCTYWMAEYKVDGFRFDFTKGFTNTPGDGWAYDKARINILKRMADKIRQQKPDALVILEHLTDNAEEKELAEQGMLLWGNLNYRMNEATMGWTQQNDDGSWNSDVSWGSYKERGWNVPNLVAYMESHDEERLMYKNNKHGNEYNGYDVKSLETGLQRTAGAAVILFSLPGPKMVWQFGEVGYDYFLGSSMEEGRLDKKPIRWDYYDDASRRELFDVYAEMIALKREKPIFNASNIRTQLAEPFKYIVLSEGGQGAVAMANFDVISVTKEISFEQTGTWKEHFTNRSETFDAAVQSITLAPGEYRLYLKE